MRVDDAVQGPETYAEIEQALGHFVFQLSYLERQLRDLILGAGFPQDSASGLALLSNGLTAAQIAQAYFAVMPDTADRKPGKARALRKRITEHIELRNDLMHGACRYAWKEADPATACLQVNRVRVTSRGLEERETFWTPSALRAEAKKIDATKGLAVSLMMQPELLALNDAGELQRARLD